MNDAIRYLSKSVNSFFISLRDTVHRVSTKISQDCPSDRSERCVSFGARRQISALVIHDSIFPATENDANPFEGQTSHRRVVPLAPLPLLLSLAAAPYALAFSKNYRSRLTLLHALEGLPESPYLDAQMARVRLHKLVAQRGDLAPEPEVMVEMGAPAKVILRAAADTACDLIVIGARGAGALPRLASHFGSVAHKVVCRAVCPVLTVRPLTDRDKEQ